MTRSFSSDDFFSVDSLSKIISEKLSKPEKNIRATIDLLLGGDTLPFIARYRKEATGGLDELDLRVVEDGLAAANDLASRKQTIATTIESQNQLTDKLLEKIHHCNCKKALEDIYLPFKPKRRTKATAAREAGLEPLAKILLAQAQNSGNPDEILRSFINKEKGVTTPEEVFAGAAAIVAETWSQDSETRQWMGEKASRGQIVSKVKRGKKEEGEKFETYFDFQQPVGRLPGHRMLAIRRGCTEGILNCKLELDDEFLLDRLCGRFLQNRRFLFADRMQTVVEDCYKRLLHPAAESSTLEDKRLQADTEAIDVFAANLRKLLLAAPAGSKPVIGIDPGFRTGCKVAVLDHTGKFLTNRTIYPTPPKNDTDSAAKVLLDLIDKYDARLISIGDGTASRETDQFVTSTLKSRWNDLEQCPVMSVVVSESGASIYSASDIAIKEFPELDLTVRGAISIARRLQDPLSELVKLDPKSIGVGQYQHDVNQSQLKKCLGREVESCVNQVGVDINLASASLLSYVAGIGPKIAENIVKHRDENGSFTSRKEINKVTGLGKKAFTQAAGFLRIAGAKNPLDNSAVHPESYSLVTKMAKSAGATVADLVGNERLISSLNASEFVDDQFGLPTVTDILEELKKPGRDPREEFRAVQFAEGVDSMEDLYIGMILEGKVTNVTKFGAFVDIGVHQDGLVHVSQIADRFISDPSEEVSVGDIVKVEVLEVDVQRKRIGLTMKVNG